jgi:hypothetical protein
MSLVTQPRSYLPIYPAHLAHLKASNFTDDEIRRVQEYCEARKDTVRHGYYPELVGFGALSIRTASPPLAEIIEQLRPGMWLRKPKDGKPHEKSLGRDWKRTPPPQDEPTLQLWSQLEQKLLGIGGSEVYWGGQEESLAPLLAKGCLFDQPMQVMALDQLCPNECAGVWGNDVQNTRLCTGYALLYDGRWAGHSWAIRNGQLLELGFPLESYFGIELNQEEALRFWYASSIRRCFKTYTRDVEMFVRLFPQVVELRNKLYPEEKGRTPRSIRALWEEDSGAKSLKAHEAATA